MIRKKFLNHAVIFSSLFFVHMPIINADININNKNKINHYDQFCDKELKKLNIDITVRSLSGWKRFFYNKQVKKYYPSLNEKEYIILKNCIFFKIKKEQIFSEIVGEK